MSVMLCMGAAFVKKNSCLVPRIVSSKLLSILILLISMLRIPILLQLFYYDMTRIFIKVEYISSAYKAVKRFLIILLLTNQSGISFNVARESSTASSHISWVIYL